MARVQDRDLVEDTHSLVAVTSLRSVGMIRTMNQSVATLGIPKELALSMRSAERVREEGVQTFIKGVNRMRSVSGASGVHIMDGAWESIVPGIVEGAGLLPRPAV